MFERCKSIKASDVAKQGGAAVAGSLLLLGMGGGIAAADSGPNVVNPTGGDKQQLQHRDGGGDQSNSLVGVDHNQIPIQACHNQIPVNVLGVQVPVHDTEADLGLGLLGKGQAERNQDKACHQPAAQQN